jgi:hypothetical protein
MGNRDELIAELNETFESLLGEVQDLSDEQMAKVWFGEWGVREILAHVAGWHWEMAPALERISRGERPVPEGVDYNDADSWNAKFSRRAAGKKGAEVLEDLRASKGAFVAAALKVPEDRFDEGRAAARMLETTGFGHYKEHSTQIRDWRDRGGI